MDFINLSTAISLTGLSKRTLWRRIADGQLRTDGTAGAATPSAPGTQTRVALDDVLEMSALELQPEDRALILDADGGLGRAQCELALLLLAQGQEAGAAEWLERAAQQGDLEGMHWRGRCLIAGQGVDADEKRGMDWIARAASHGHAAARRMVQFLYDPARPALSGTELDAELDAIERRVLLETLEGLAEGR